MTHGDYLKTNPRDKRFAGVTAMIIDPSCRFATLWLPVEPPCLS